MWEAGLQLDLPLGIRREGMPLRSSPLGVEVDQLAGHLGSGLPRLRLHVQPLLATQRREGRAGRTAGITREFVELLDRRVDPVLAFVFEVEVVTGHPGNLSGLKAGEAGYPVVFMDHEVSDPEVGEGQSAPGGTRCAVIGLEAAIDETTKGKDGHSAGRPDEAFPQPGLDQARPGTRRDLSGQCDRGTGGLHRVLGPLGLADGVEGYDYPVAALGQPLDLGLGLGQVTGRGVGPGGPEDGPLARVIGLALAWEIEDEVGPIGQVTSHIHVEVLGIPVLRSGRDVIPEVVERALDLTG